MPGYDFSELCSQFRRRGTATFSTYWVGPIHREKRTKMESQASHWFATLNGILRKYENTNDDLTETQLNVQHGLIFKRNLHSARNAHRLAESKTMKTLQDHCPRSLKCKVGSDFVGEFPMTFHTEAQLPTNADPDRFE